MNFLLSFSFSSVIIASIVLLIAMLNRYKKRKADTNCVKCENSACVRCKTYTSVLLSAKNRLRQFVVLTGASESDLMRIGKGLNKVDDLSENECSSNRKPEVFDMSNLNSSPFWNLECCSDTFLMDIETLKNHSDEISREFSYIWQQQRTLWLTNNTPSGSWSVFHIINQGKNIDNNIKHCPLTHTIVLKLRTVMKNNVFGNVAFSVIEPLTTITKHYGPTNIRLRCHLGLVTLPQCKLEVASECRSWSNGECLLFDDSYYHGVKHSGEQGIRAILMVDMWHPDISQQERRAIDFIFSPSIREH